MKLTPLGDRVVLKQLEAETTTKSGIVLTTATQEKPQEADVIEVGPGRVNESGKTIPLSVKKGDRVLIGKYSGTEVTIDGVEHLIVREDEILAIINR